MNRRNLLRALLALPFVPVALKPQGYATGGRIKCAPSFIDRGAAHGPLVIAVKPPQHINCRSTTVPIMKELL